jgi:hypothetical protein
MLFLDEFPTRIMADSVPIMADSVPFGGPNRLFPANRFGTSQFSLLYKIGPPHFPQKSRSLFHQTFWNSDPG